MVLGKEVRFSLTTNATLLRPEVIEWLADNEVGFWSVGFAPVTTADGRDYAIEGDSFKSMLAQFDELAEEFGDDSAERPLRPGLPEAQPPGTSLRVLAAFASTAALVKRKGW